MSRVKTATHIVIGAIVVTVAGGFGIAALVVYTIFHFIRKAW